VKIILAGLAFSTFMASPFARSQTTEGPAHSRAYLEQKKQSRVDYRDLDGGAHKTNHPTPNPYPMTQGLVQYSTRFLPRLPWQ
jgi:hypothetical protein